MCKRRTGGVAFGDRQPEPRALRTAAEGDSAHEGAEHHRGRGVKAPGWEALEAYAREGIRRMLQQMLKEEIEEVLARQRYARRAGVDAASGYRNGWGKPRRLSLMSGTITLRWPRVRGLERALRVNCCRCSSGH